MGKQRKPKPRKPWTFDQLIGANYFPIDIADARERQIEGFARDLADAVRVIELETQLPIGRTP